MITTLVLSAWLSAQTIVVDPLTPFPDVPEAKQKAAVPQDVEPGIKKVRESQGAALTQAKTPFEKVDLATRLVTLAIETKDEAVTQWAALSEGARLALEAENVLVAFWIVDAQDRLFVIDRGQQRLNLLKKFAQQTPAPSPAGFQAAGKAALIAGREAEQAAKTAEDYDTVQALADLAADLAAKGKDPAARDVQKYRDNVKVLRKDFEDALAAKAKLETAADDIEANRTWGKYLALQRLDWDQGLPFLAKADGPLGEAAKADQAGPETPDDQEAAANKWWKLADTDKKLPTAALRTRAAMWYRKALPRLPQAGRTRVEAKLKNVPTSTTAASTFPKPFDPSSLKSGLMVRAYPRQPQQRGANRFVPADQLGEPLGEPVTARTMETFTFLPDNNLAAFGYMRIDNPGSYYFHIPNHQPVLILVDGRPAVPFGGKAATLRFSRKGYVPLMIVGYVDTREVHLEWLSDDSVRPTPPLVFHDPERVRP